MAPRPPLDGATAPELSPAELAAAAARLRLVAACPIAKMPVVEASPGVHVEAHPTLAAHSRVRYVTDCGRQLGTAVHSDLMLDVAVMCAMEEVRRQKSAEIAERCAACRACARVEPTPIRRGLLTLTR